MQVNPFGGPHPVAGEPEQLIDWPATERDGFVFSRENTVVNAFGYAAYAAMAKIAAVVGDSRPPPPATRRSPPGSSRRCRRDCTTRPPARSATASASATRPSSPASTRWRSGWPARPRPRRPPPAIARQGMACSVYCAGYLLEALYDGGQAQAALSLLTADRQHQLAAHDRLGRGLHHGGLDARDQAEPDLLPPVGRVARLHRPRLPVRRVGPVARLADGADPAAARQPDQRHRPGADRPRHGDGQVHPQRHAGSRPRWTSRSPRPPRSRCRE